MKVMSIGFFVEEDSAVVWRGPMLHKALTQFLEDVEWGELDFLLVDLPPGTGDVSMTLAQLLPAGEVPASSPRRSPWRRRSRAAPPRWPTRSTSRSAASSRTWPRFVTPVGERFTLFGEGGGQALADELDVPAAGQGPADDARCASSPTPASRSSSPTPTTRPRRPSATPPAGSWRCSRVELPILQAAAPAAPAAAPTGMSLPMAG